MAKPLDCMLRSDFVSSLCHVHVYGAESAVPKSHHQSILLVSNIAFLSPCFPKKLSSLASLHPLSRIAQIRHSSRRASSPPPTPDPTNQPPPVPSPSPSTQYLSLHFNAHSSSNLLLAAISASHARLTHPTDSTENPPPHRRFMDALACAPRAGETVV